MSMNNYYQFSAPTSLELLRVLAKQQNDVSFSAFLNEYTGDLERRLGQTEAARRHYTQAEELCRAEQDNLGLANVLQSMGDLERRLGQMEAARNHYTQAEELYRAEQDNLGLANVLQSMGDLESRLGQTEAARHHYTQAEELFRAEQDNLGLANALQSMGDLERQQKNYALSIHHYEKSLFLYDKEQELMGKSYTMGELCRASALAGNTEEALQWLDKTKRFFDRMPENVRAYVSACIKETLGLLGIDADAL